ncbi:TPA: ATP-grasp domain-containing protein [Proteus mirabilis]
MNILLTSVGRRTYLIEYFRSALSNIGGKIFAANSIKTYSLTIADEYFITPPIYSNEYIPMLLSYCKKNRIDIIISCFDIDLPILSKNKKIFKENNINIIVSNEYVIDVCNDKWKTYLFLKENNINTPTTFLSITEAKKSLLEDELEYPVIIKPRWGMGSIGIYKADNNAELDIFYNKVKNDILSSYLKYESSVDPFHSVLIQQYIDGREYGIEVINDLNENYVTTFCKKKLAMRSGETDQAVTIKSNELKTLGKKISTKLKHLSILDIDCLEKNNKFYILEMNARFGGQYPFSHLAGVNIPKQIIEWCQGKMTSSDNINIKYDVLSCKDINPKIIND